MDLLNMLLHGGMEVAGSARQERLQAPCDKCGEDTPHLEGLYTNTTEGVIAKFTPHMGLLHIAIELKQQVSGSFVYTCVLCGSHIHLNREKCSEQELERVARNSSIGMGKEIAKDFAKGIIKPLDGG